MVLSPIGMIVITPRHRGTLVHANTQVTYRGTFGQLTGVKVCMLSSGIAESDILLRAPRTILKIRRVGSHSFNKIVLTGHPGNLTGLIVVVVDGRDSRVRVITNLL